MQRPEINQPKANIDHLTGLLNRRGWEEAIETRREDIESGGPWAVGAFDIDGLKAVNDDLGHDTGDKMLRSIAEILHSNTRHSTDSPYQDIAAAARSGGDEMWTLWDMTRQDNPGLPMTERVDAAVERIRGEFDNYIQSNEDLRTRRVGVSIGTAIARADVTVEQLLSEADESAQRDKIMRLPPLDASGQETLGVIHGLLGTIEIDARSLQHYFKKYDLE